MTGEALFTEGINALNQGQYHVAVDLLQQAVAIAPEFVDAWFHLGRVLYETRNEPGAMNAWRRVLALKPDHAEAKKLLQYAQQYSVLKGTQE